jgi:tetratricopeptide (TPR) repeat protein
MRGHTRNTIACLLVVIGLTAGCATVGFLESVDSLLKQGRELYEAKRYDEALAKFREVITREPGSWSAYLYSARAYLAKAAWSPAIESGRKAYDLAPAGQDVVPVFAEALAGGGRDALARGQYAEAISRLGEYVRLKPADAHGYLDLGRAYLGSGRYSDALGTVLRGLGQGGDTKVRQELTATLLEGGRQALGQGDLQSGIGFLKEYVQRDPSRVSAYLDLGKAYWQSGQQADALSAFRRVLELQPGNQEALRFLLGTSGR